MNQVIAGVNKKTGYLNDYLSNQISRMLRDVSIGRLLVIGSIMLI